MKIKKSNKSLYDTIIVGAGIPGCTAAIYAARKRMKFALVSEDFGGQFMVSGEVLNYPGIKQTTGANFAQMMIEQLEFNGVKPELGIRVKKSRGKEKIFC